MPYMYAKFLKQEFEEKENPICGIYVTGIHDDSHHISSAYYVPALSQLLNIHSEI